MLVYYIISQLQPMQLGIYYAVSVSGNKYTLYRVDSISPRAGRKKY